MNSIGAFTEGIRRAGRAPCVLAGVFVLTFVVTCRSAWRCGR